MKDDFSFTDKKEAEELVKKGTLACFIYERRFLVNGKVRVYREDTAAVRAVQKAGTTLAPIELFSALDDTSVAAFGDEMRISRGDYVLDCTASEDRYTLNGEEKRFTVPAEKKHGSFFVPVIETARALDLMAKSYNDKRLTVIAPDTVHSAMLDNPRLQHAISRLIMGDYDPYSVTHEGYKIAKDKWRKALVGDKKINDIHRPEVIKKLKAIEDDCESALSIMNTAPGSVILFGTEAPTVSYELRRQYGHLYKLALAYGSYGNKFYLDTELKEKILSGLKWLYENMYGEAEMEGRGWRDPKAFNWYDWFVGGPDPMTDTLLIMEDHISDREMKDYLKPLAWITTIHRLENDHPCSMSRVIVCTKMGLLLEDPKWLAREYEDYDRLLELNEYGEGPRIDGCEWTHTHPYNMIYGINNLCRVLKVGAILAGTPLEYRTPRQYNLFFLVKYMFDAALYKGQGMVMFDGRDNSSSEMKNGVAILSYILPMVGMFGEDEDRYIKGLIRRNAVREEFLSRLKSFCSLYNYSVLEDALAGSDSEGDSDFTLAHAWFTADRAVQHKNGYCFALAMCSERGRNYESINGANKTGWYTGDGALFLYTDADSHAFDGINFISSLDISYRIPGTTVDTQEREIKSIRSAWHMPRDFVGSMQLHQRYVTAAMDYESYHFEGPYDDTPDTGYGGGLPLHSNDLVAKKAWFMLDRCCVCLGAEINSTTGYDVNTVVEHRRLVKEDSTTRGVENIAVNGELLPKGEYEGRVKDAKSLNVEGFAGFVFPDGCCLYYSKYERLNAPTRCEYFGEISDDGKGKPYFEARIEHGKNPKNASYSYIVVPEATEKILEEQAREVEILSNDGNIQAVYSKSIGLTSIVFRRADEICGIKTDTPCLVMTSERNGIYTFSVCDPTQKAKRATVVINKKLKLKSAHDRLTAEDTGDGIKITVDFDGSYARNLVAEFEI